MRLQKHLSRRVGDVEYAKYVLTIPHEVVKSMGWRKGTELKFEPSNGYIVIKRKSRYPVRASSQNGEGRMWKRPSKRPVHTDRPYGKELARIVAKNKRLLRELSKN